MAKPRNKRKRTGIFIYCSDELKGRIKDASKQTGRTITGYVMQCLLPQLARDEKAAVKARN